MYKKLRKKYVTFIGFWIISYIFLKKKRKDLKLSIFPAVPLFVQCTFHVKATPLITLCMNTTGK